MKKKPLNKKQRKNLIFYGDTLLEFQVPKLVEILWVDAYTVGGAEWMEKEESSNIAKSALPYMITVGFILYQDRHQIAVTNTVGSDETAQVWKIPKRMIIRTRLLP